MLSPSALYTPDSCLRSPRELFREMAADLIRSRSLAWRLFLRDVRAQYRHSVLGAAWALVPPVATALIFVLLIQHKVVNIRETPIPYPAFALWGTVLWQVFVESFNAPLKAVSASRGLFGKVRFPHEAVVLSGLGQVVFGLLFKLAILGVVVLLYGVTLTWWSPLALLALVSLMVLGTALGLLLTPLGMLFGDIPRAMGLLTTLWFFLTPVVYPVPTGRMFTVLGRLNPVSPLLQAARTLATRGTLEHGVDFALVSAGALVLLLVAWLFYRVSIPILVERIGG